MLLALISFLRPALSSPVVFEALAPVRSLRDAVKEQQGIINDQKKKIDELEKRLMAIEKKIQ